MLSGGNSDARIKLMITTFLKNYVTFLNLSTKYFCKFSALPCCPLRFDGKH
ncbi:hypothetical protein RAVI111496_17225 [Rahnella victoriana]